MGIWRGAVNFHPKHLGGHQFNWYSVWGEGRGGNEILLYSSVRFSEVF